MNNILDISKLESGSMVLDDKPFDLFALLERQTEVIEAYANDNTVQLINAIDHQKMKIIIGILKEKVVSQTIRKTEPMVAGAKRTASATG